MSVAEKVVEDIDNIVSDLRENVSEIGEEIGEAFRDGYQAGTTALREIVEKNYQDGIKIPLDGAIEKVKIIGEVIDTLTDISTEVITEIVDIISTLQVSVWIRAKGDIDVVFRAQSITTKFSFSPCEDFNYSFNFLEIFTMETNYNFNSGIISFSSIIGESTIELNIPFITIPESMRLQCEEEPEPEPEPEPEDEDEILDDCGNTLSLEDIENLPDDRYYLFTAGSNIHYEHHTSSLGTNYHKYIVANKNKTEIQIVNITPELRRYRWRNNSQTATTENRNPVFYGIRKNASGTSVGGENVCVPTETVYNSFPVQYRDTSSSWDSIRFSSLTKDEVISTIQGRNQRRDEYIEENSIDETYVINHWACGEYTKQIKTVINYTLSHTVIPTIPREGECELPKPRPKKPEVPDVQLEDDSCCSMTRKILERLGGEDFEVDMLNELTEGEESTVYETIPEMIIQGNKYLDELTGQYPIKVQVGDDDAPVIPLPNQAEAIGELYALLSKALAEMTVVRDVAYKALLNTELLRQSIIQTSARVETIQDYMNFKVNQSKEKYNSLIKPDENNFDGILQESEQEVDIEITDPTEQTLSEAIVELQQAAAIIKAVNLRQNETINDELAIITDNPNDTIAGAAPSNWDEFVTWVKEDYPRLTELEIEPDIWGTTEGQEAG